MNYKSALGKGIRGTLKTAGVIAAAYVALYATDFVTDQTATRIKTQRELDEIVAEEARNFGYEGQISGQLKDTTMDDWKHSGENKYKIRVGGALATRKTVKHLLAHLSGEHENTEGNQNLIGSLGDELKYWFIQEPEAIIKSLQ